MKTLHAFATTLLLVLVGVITHPSLLPASPQPAAAMPAPHALDDAQIFAIFDEVNAADIWTARLGAKKGHSVEVRDLAQSVVSDHEQVQQMMRDLARKLGITPIPPDNDSTAQDHAQTITLLQDKSGADFDRAYLQHEIEFHSAAVKAVKQTLLPSIRNQEFRTLVQSVLPGFEHHLAETAETARKLGYK
jgi:putative membrane protein